MKKIIIPLIITITSTIAICFNNANKTSFNKVDIPAENNSVVSESGYNNQPNKALHIDCDHVLESAGINDEGDAEAQLKEDFNFDNYKNILVVYQSSPGFDAQIHVNNSANTDPSQSQVEYHCSHVYVGSCNIFMSNTRIYLSVKAGFETTYKEWYVDPFQKNGYVHTLNISGNAVSVSYGTTETFGTADDGDRVLNDLQPSTTWANLRGDIGKFDVGKSWESNSQNAIRGLYDGLANYLYNNKQPKECWIPTISNSTNVAIGYFDAWKFA